MDNPIIVDCPANQWEKVAENVIGGIIDIVQTGRTYAHTYRLTGEAIPSGTPGGEAVKFAGQLNISATEPIDVYIFSLKEDGKVRVSI